MSTIRQMFGNGPARDRDTAIIELARSLGYRRTGIRVRQVLDADIRTAVRRGILKSTRGELALNANSIDAYERAFLKEQFLASLQGRAWPDRDEATRAFARWLGFRRTGRNIEDTVKSLINGLLREGRLGSRQVQIRRL